ATMLSLNSSRVQLFVLLAGAMAGLLFCRESREESGEVRTMLPVHLSIAALVLCVVLFAVPLLFHSGAADLFAAFYRTAALVFCGVHVVLPLLERATVARGWLSQQAFLAGYGAAQALPGPLFSFAAYLGAIATPRPGAAGAVIALVAIFLPGLLLVIAVL